MTDGIHTITADAYHADPCDKPSLSASIACVLVNASPAHARAAHPKLNPTYARQEEQKFDVGTAAHSIFLQGDNKIRVVYADDWRTKEAKELRDSARADGLTPLLEKQADAVQEMVAAVREQISAIDITPPLFTDGQPEQTILWEDDYGVMCRARLDWLRDDLQAIDDLKSTSASANPDAWTRRTMWSIGAHIQTRFYQRGVKAITGVEPEFRYVVVETYPPFALSVVSLAPAAVAIADDMIDGALRTWARCLERDEWPAYASKIAYAEPPGWLEMAWLEKKEIAA